MDNNDFSTHVGGPEEIAPLLNGSGLLTPVAILGASAINATVAWKNTSRNIEAQNKRDERLKELQERHRLEDKRFQIARDQENERFQLEMEANRMNFQEHMELRRLQFQVKMEEQREKFQAALQTQQIKSSRELAQFQAQAMRETQILVSRENAQNLLGNQMILEALKMFPLNISPMVLFNNRPHSLSSLLRFTTSEHIEIDINGRKKLIETGPHGVIQDVLNYAEHPEALNIFIAPVFVDSKMDYQHTLSAKIWGLTYQKIESFFTKHYSRSSQRPVVFYPTAWNDKYTSGVHASETLHFFLKDLPCIVLEPKFDGNKLRMAVSSWGLGYGSTEHFRTECTIDVNIDIAIAIAAYNRSKNTLDAINIMQGAVPTNQRQKLEEEKVRFNKNINMYKAFKIGDIQTMDTADRQKLYNQIAALGVDKIFSIDISKDLEPVANYFASQIGAALAMLSDIHHLVATRVDPVLPDLMNKEGYFGDIFKDKTMCKKLSEAYASAYILIRDEECSLALEKEESDRIYGNRNTQLTAIKEKLGFMDDESWEKIVSRFVRDRFGYEDDDFEKVWSKFIIDTDESDLSRLKAILPLIKDEEKSEMLSEKISNFL